MNVFFKLAADIKGAANVSSWSIGARAGRECLRHTLWPSHCEHTVTHTLCSRCCKTTTTTTTKRRRKKLNLHERLDVSGVDWSVPYDVFGMLFGCRLTPNVECARPSGDKLSRPLLLSPPTPRPCPPPPPPWTALKRRGWGVWGAEGGGGGGERLCIYTKVYNTVSLCIYTFTLYINIRPLCIHPPTHPPTHTHRLLF